MISHMTLLARAALGVALTTTVALGQRGMDRMAPMDSGATMKMMADGPAASKEAAMFMTHKYKEPEAMSADMAMWGKIGVCLGARRMPAHPCVGVPASDSSPSGSRCF